LVVSSIPWVFGASGHKLANNKDCYRRSLESGQTLKKAAWASADAGEGGIRCASRSGERIGRVTCRQYSLAELRFGVPDHMTDPLGSMDDLQKPARPVTLQRQGRLNIGRKVR
jgi:hypothetical protein